MQEAQDSRVGFLGLTYSDKPYAVYGVMDGDLVRVDIYAFTRYGEVIETPVSRCHINPKKQSVLVCVDRLCHVIAKGLLTIYETRDIVFEADDLYRKTKLRGRTVVRYA